MSEIALPVYSELLPGVTLGVCSTDKFKVGRFSLSFLLPLDIEATPVRTLLFSVLRRGCEAYPTLTHINRRLDELYATPYHVNNASCGAYQHFGFTVELLGEDYLPDGTDLTAHVLSLMKQMLFHPLTEQDGMLSVRYTDAEKKNTIDYLRSVHNFPADHAMIRFSEMFYRDELWGHPLTGNETQVEGITPARLYAEWQSLVRNAPIRCFYIGNLSADVPADHARKLLGDELIRMGRSYQGSVMLPQRCSQPLAVPSSPMRMEEKLNGGQSHLILGFRTDVTLASPDFYAMMLCHEILGVSPVSRLFVHVREKYGLCYSCASEYRIDRGDLIIRCGLSAENRETAEAAILEQLHVMRLGEFSEAEWNAARRSLESSYRQVADSTEAIANFYELRAVLGVHQTIEDCCRHFAAVTREQVIAVARKIRLDAVYFGQGTGEYNEDEENEDG